MLFLCVLIAVVGWHQVPNAVERLLLAETTGTGAGQLKEEAIRFITANTAAVSKTEGYMKLRKVGVAERAKRDSFWT